MLRFVFAKVPVLSRRFNSSAVVKGKHALIISGGRPSGLLQNILFKPYPEESQLQNVIEINKNLSRSSQFVSLKTLFGAGFVQDPGGDDETIATVYSNTLFVRTIAQIDKMYKGKEEPGFLFRRNRNDLPFIHDSCTYENIRKSILDLCATAHDNDQIYLFFDGHGELFKGLCIWGDSRRGSLLQIPMISKILTEAKTKKTIILVVDSCHGGMWDLLRQEHKNVITLSSASIKSVAYYKYEECTIYTQQVSRCFSESNSPSENLLTSHAKGALMGGNYYPSDSMSIFLDTSLSRQLPAPLFKMINRYSYLRAKYALQNSYLGATGDFVFHFTIGLCIALQPIRELDDLYMLKIYGSFLLKNVAILKMATFFASYTLYNRVKNTITQTELYKQYPTKQDRILVKILGKKLDNRLNSDAVFDVETLNYILSRRSELLNILSRTEIFSDKEFAKPVYSTYMLIREKMCLFLLYSLINGEEKEVLDEFIKIGSILLNVNDISEDLDEKPTLKHFSDSSQAHAFFRNHKTDAMLSAQLVEFLHHTGKPRLIVSNNKQDSNVGKRSFSTSLNFFHIAEREAPRIVDDSCSILPIGGTKKDIFSCSS